MRKEIDDSGGVTISWYLSSFHPTCGDVAGRVDIGMPRPSTGYARKGFAGTVALMLALVAGLACPSGVDFLCFDPCKGGLVSDELVEFSKAPPRDHPVQMPAAGLRSTSDSFQVLHPDGSESFLNSQTNRIFGDVMIGPRDKTPLPAGKPPKDALCAFGAFALERRPCSPEPILDGLNPIARNDFPGGEGSDVLDTEVDPQGRASTLRRFSRLDDNMDVPFLSVPDDLGASRFRPLEKIALIHSDFKGDMDSSPQGGKGNGFILFAEVKDSGIVVYAGGMELLNDSPLLGRDFDRVGHSCDGADSEVRGEAVVLPDLMVNRVLEFDLVRGLEPAGLFENTVGGLGEGYRGFKKGIFHNPRRDHSALDRTLHDVKMVSHMATICQPEKEAALPPLGLKPRGFRAVHR